MAGGAGGVGAGEAGEGSLLMKNYRFMPKVST